MARHISQAICKGNKWVQLLQTGNDNVKREGDKNRSASAFADTQLDGEEFDEEDGEEEGGVSDHPLDDDEARGSAPTEETATTTEMMFAAWNHEHQRAYRVMSDGTPQFTVNIKKPADEQPNSPMIAVFPDGDIQLHDLNYAEWQLLKEAESTAPKRHTAMFNGMRDGKTVKLLRCSLGEKNTPGIKIVEDGSAQILQLHADAPGAVEVMQEVARKYCSGELERVQLRQARNDMLELRRGSPVAAKAAPTKKLSATVAAPEAPALSAQAASSSASAVARFDAELNSF